jgi:predicted nucleic acid-binding protein
VIYLLESLYGIEIKSSNGQPWYDWLAIQKLDNNSVICNADEGQEYSNRKGIKVVDISSQCDDEMTLPSVQVIAEKEGVVKRQYSLVESPLRSSKHEQLNEEVVTVTASETSDGKQPCIVS